MNGVGEFALVFSWGCRVSFISCRASTNAGSTCYIFSKCMGNLHVVKIEMVTLGTHDSAVSVFQNLLPISKSLVKWKISNILTAISRELKLILLLIL